VPLFFAGNTSVAVADVISKSPAHMHFTLGDIEWMNLPAVVPRQAHVAEMQRQALGRLSQQ
jgi:hypothetical protein